MARPTGRPVRDELVAEARALIQQVGVGGFSYGVLADRLGISAPSIHHHFRTKEDLVAEVAARYRSDFADTVAAIDHPSAGQRLAAYVELYAETSTRSMLCLCGAVAAEWGTVGAKPRSEVEGFFADQRAWLETTLAAGVEAGEYRPDLDVAATASALLATLEGALLLARADGEADLVGTSCAAVIRLLAPG